MQELIQTAMAVGVVGLGISKPSQNNVFMHLGEHTLRPLLINQQAAVDAGGGCIMQSRFKRPARDAYAEGADTRARGRHHIIAVALGNLWQAYL